MTEPREERREYGEEERVAEHSGTNHSMAIGSYIAAIVLIFGVTLVLARLISSGQAAQGNVGFNINPRPGPALGVSGGAVPRPGRAGQAPAGRAARGNVGFNINLWWGLVMVVSGCVILGMTLASPRRRAERAARNR